MAAKLIVPLGPIKAGLGSSSETDSSAADGRWRESSDALRLKTKFV